MTSQVSLQFLGAAGTVTGSRFLVRGSEHQVLIDAGMFQGLKELRLKNWEPFPVNPAAISAVVLTHAHLDHCGYLPALVRDGFNGVIVGTQWTLKLAEVVLRDAARLQEEDADYATKKGFSKHDNPRPLYDTQAVEQTLKLFQAAEFRQPVSLFADFEVQFYPAGHVLGAAFVEVKVQDKRLLFTGDMGRPSHPLLQVPDRIPDGRFDAVIAESTYGDREHEPSDGVFASAIRRTLTRGGSVLIPAFAVDRTEVILMELKRLMDEQQIPRVPVFADSPMALKTLQYYRDALAEGSPELRGDQIAAARLQDPFNPGKLKEVMTIGDSKLLNHPQSPCIIVSASGMATGGRVVHHLEGMLPNSLHTILLVGYQAEGTRGRYLADGATSIKMYGQYVPVRAEVVQVGTFSVHASASELIDWLSRATELPTVCYVVHGETGPATAFAERIERQLGWSAVVPRDGERVLI